MTVRELKDRLECFNQDIQVMREYDCNLFTLDHDAIRIHSIELDEVERDMGDGCDYEVGEKVVVIG